MMDLFLLLICILAIVAVVLHINETIEMNRYAKYGGNIFSDIFKKDRKQAEK